MFTADGERWLYFIQTETHVGYAMLEGDTRPHPVGQPPPVVNMRDSPDRPVSSENHGAFCKRNSKKLVKYS